MGVASGQVSSTQRTSFDCVMHRFIGLASVSWALIHFCMLRLIFDVRVERVGALFCQGKLGEMVLTCLNEGW